MMKYYTKLEALEYMVKAGPYHENDTSKSGMYDAVSKIIISSRKHFTKRRLDNLIERLTNS